MQNRTRWLAVARSCAPRNHCGRATSTLLDRQVSRGLASRSVALPPLSPPCARLLRLTRNVRASFSTFAADGARGPSESNHSASVLEGLKQIQADLEHIKQSDQADQVAKESERIVARIDDLGKDIKMSVVEDEGQQIELPENEDEKKLFNRLMVESLYLCGDALLCLGKHKEALTYLDRVIEMRPNHIDALLARGELYVDLGDDKKAMKDFNEVRYWDPNNPDALFYAASLLRKTMKKIASDKTDLDDFFSQVETEKDTSLARGVEPSATSKE